ncbi:MAG: FeoB-associated Cys-rich membrane protein [Clostridiales bacterium]|nr:FeoB-associated Cys-rich membrane protein [Clostridiales bacterium]
MGRISDNLGTIVISLILAAVVALVIVKMVRDKMKGKSSCGCGCSNCAMRGSCHAETGRSKKGEK